MTISGASASQAKRQRRTPSTIRAASALARPEKSGAPTSSAPSADSARLVADEHHGGAGRLRAHRGGGLARRAVGRERSQALDAGARLHRAGDHSAVWTRARERARPDDGGDAVVPAQAVAEPARLLAALQREVAM